MKTNWRPLLFLVLFVWLSSAPVVDAQELTFQRNVNLINVTFSARNPQGIALSDLKQSDVEVLEDDLPQTIRFFDHSTLPLTVGLLVDVSGSQETFFRQHHKDLEKFLKDALDPQDQAFLLSFGNHLRLLSDLTNSAGNIMQAYARFEHGDRSFPELGPTEVRTEGTALFDAIYYSVHEKLQNLERGRRALIVFSDGEDNSSSYDIVDAIDAAQNADVLVYCVRYTPQKNPPTARNKYGVRAMQRIAHDTGAEDFDASNGASLEATFKQIGAELRTLYTAGYHANNHRRDNTFRRIRINVNRPDAIVKVKAGYYARP
jgi:Ca-activated chloride channel family protein